MSAAVSDLISVWVPTSPSPRHPSTELLELAIESVRTHLPNVEVIVQMDGIRPENENRREAYTEYKRRVATLCSTKYVGVIPLEFAEFSHQAEMARATFPLTTKPLLLYFEWDWILLDRPIDWQAMATAILMGQLNHIRICRWEEIHPAHVHLMDGYEVIDGCPVTKTHQWSGHPALASTEFFKRIIGMFRPGCRTLIEEFIYGPVATSPWEAYRCAVYSPEGGYRRIEHTDGREGDPKFPAQF